MGMILGIPDGLVQAVLPGLCPFAGLGPKTSFGNGHDLLFVSPMPQGARGDLAPLRCHPIPMPALSSLLHPLPPPAAPPPLSPADLLTHPSRTPTYFTTPPLPAQLCTSLPLPPPPSSSPLSPELSPAPLHPRHPVGCHPRPSISLTPPPPPSLPLALPPRSHLPPRRSPPGSARPSAAPWRSPPAPVTAPRARIDPRRPPSLLRETTTLRPVSIATRPGAFVALSGRDRAGLGPAGIRGGPGSRGPGCVTGSRAGPGAAAVQDLLRGAGQGSKGLGRGPGNRAGSCCREQGRAAVIYMGF